MHSNQKDSTEQNDSSVDLNGGGESKNAKWMKNILPEDFLK